MNGAFLRRAGAAAGVGIFVLSLFVQIGRADSGVALFVALLAGLGVGGAVFLAGVMADATAKPPVVTQAPPPPEAPPSLEDTRTLPPEEVSQAADLHQTVKLDQGVVDYILPEVSHEDLFRDREGIDETFLKQGIEELGASSENIPEVKPEGGQTE